MTRNSGYMTVNLDKVFILFLLNVPSTHFLSVLTEALLSKGSLYTSDSC